MRSNFLIAGGLAVTAIAAKYLYERFFNKHDKIAKNIIIQKLITTRQQLYPILYQISYFVSQQLIPKGIPPDQAKLYIMQNQQLGFKQRIIQTLQQKIYDDIDEQSLQYCIQNDYKNDQQVQYYKKQFQEEYQKCFLGIQPSMETTKITIINTETILKVTENMLKSNNLLYQSTKYIGKLQSLKQVQKQSINLQGKYDYEKLQKLLIQNQNQDDQYRNKIIKQNRLGNVKNLQLSISKFIKQNQQFKNKYVTLQKYYHEEVKQIFKENN